MKEKQTTDDSNLGWLGGPKGAAAMYALRTLSRAAQERRNQQMIAYQEAVNKLRGQQDAAAAGQQMAQSLRF